MAPADDVLLYLQLKTASREKLDAESKRSCRPKMDQLTERCLASEKTLHSEGVHRLQMYGVLFSLIISFHSIANPFRYHGRHMQPGGTFWSRRRAANLLHARDTSESRSARERGKERVRYLTVKFIFLFNFCLQCCVAQPQNSAVRPRFWFLRAVLCCFAFLRFSQLTSRYSFRQHATTQRRIVFALTLESLGFFSE